MNFSTYLQVFTQVVLSKKASFTVKLRDAKYLVSLSAKEHTSPLPRVSIPEAMSLAMTISTLSSLTDIPLPTVRLGGLDFSVVITSV